MPSLITFGECDINIIYAIIGGLGRLFSELIYKFDSEIHFHPFLLGIASGLGMCLSLIPLCYLKKQSESLNIRESVRDTIMENKTIYKNEYINNYVKQNMKCKKYILLLITAFLDFAQKTLSFIFSTEIILNFWAIDILFLSIFSLIILKTKLYIHQIISMVVIILLGIIIIIIHYINNPEKNFKILILISIIEIIYCLSVVISKYLMENQFCSPYEISFYQGILALILNTLLLTIFDNSFDYFSIKFFIIFIIIMICRLLYNLFSLIIVNKYTPSHVVYILIIGEIIFEFNGAELKEKWKKILKPIIIVFLLFMILVFTEIIELNFCGLQKYTRKSISERADNKSEKSDDSKIEIEERFIVDSGNDEELIKEEEKDENVNEKENEF